MKLFHLNKKFLVLFLITLLAFQNCAYAKNILSYCKEKIKHKKEVPVNNMPKTVEEYEKMSKEKRVIEYDIKEPEFPKDKKIVNEPYKEVSLVNYNSPGGSRVIDISKLKAKGRLHGQGIATTTGDKLAYSEVYYDRVDETVKSEIYTILNTENKDVYTFLKTANVATRINKPILQSGISDIAFGQQNILTPIDWSKDGTKLAVKETIGNSHNGIWKTNLWVYDYSTQKATPLPQIRSEIIYTWQMKKNLNLNDYLWNICPLGWDMDNDNNLIVTAYLLKKDHTLFFLGEWSISADGSNVRLISDKQPTKRIKANGFTLNVQNKY